MWKTRRVPSITEFCPFSEQLVSCSRLERVLPLVIHVFFPQSSLVYR